MAKAASPKSTEGTGAVRRPRTARSAVDYDVVIAADMSVGGWRGFRIASEIQAYARAGYRVALVHLPPPGRAVRICPDVQGTVSAGIADPVDPAAAVSASRLLLWGAETLASAPVGLDGLRVDETCVVAEQLPTYDVRRVHRLLVAAVGPTMWAPANPAIRAALRSRFSSIPLARDDRRPAAPPAQTPREERIGHRMIIGEVGGEGIWPATSDEVRTLFPADGAFDIRLLGSPLAPVLPVPAGWTVLAADCMPVGRFLDHLDALVHFPRVPEEAATSVVVSMLAAGKPVLLSPKLKAVYGDGPIYCEPPAVGENLRHYIVDPAIRRITRAAGVAAAARLSAPVRPINPPTVAARPARPTMLLIPSNGTGLGHVATLLAIARRTQDFDPLFVSMAQAVDVIQSFGFPAEYISSSTYLGSEFHAWDRWFQAQLEQIIDSTNARLVLYDGNNPSPGLVRAVGSRATCGLAWIRASMTGEAAIAFAENSRYFDLVVQPGELALENATRRPEDAVRTAPVLLLDRDELLSRAAAAERLGLDPARPAVLLQLGSGSNRDLPGLTARILDELAAFDGLQIAVGEWSTGVPLPPLPRNATLLRGFPFSQFYRAFDFTISAAGYNSFHELIAYGIPTIFIANTHPTMDDQRGRSRYAEANNLALELDEDDLASLPEMIRALMAEPARAFLRDNCAALTVGDGAAQVCRLLAARFTGRA